MTDPTPSQDIVSPAEAANYVNSPPWSALEARLARTVLSEPARIAAAVAHEHELRVAFEGAACDLAQSGIAERDALRRVIAILSRTDT